MATVRKGEREIDRGREENQKEQKKNRAGLTFGFSVSKTPPPSVACPHVSLLCLVRISCPVSYPAPSLSQSFTLLLLLSFPQNSAYSHYVFSQAAHPPRFHFILSVLSSRVCVKFPMPD